MDIRHFILTNDGAIREFAADDAVRIANGVESVPSLADSRVRYLQVLVVSGDDDITVRTAGTVVRFDEDGVIAGIGPESSDSDSSDESSMIEPDPDPAISAFEHDACVEFALMQNLPGRFTHH